MHEVSCRTTSLLLSGLRFKGVNPRALYADLPVAYEVLRDPSERIDWDLYAELLFRAREALGSNEALETLAMHHRDAPALAHLRKVAKTLLSARAIYSNGSMRLGNALFMAPVYELEHLDDGRIREVLSIPEPYRNSEEFFYMMRGIIRAGPRQLGLPDSRVEMKLVGRRAEYLITPPPSESLWARGQRWLQRTRAASDAWEELGEQQGQLAENYRSLRRAHQRIQQQSRRLERQNRWARELTEHLELDALTRRTVSLLRSKGPYRGVALTLRTPDGELRELHRDDNPKDLIGRREELHLGDRSVGQIEVWGQETQADVGFMEDALPWIALALDNARAYDEIQAKKRALEAEVGERLRTEERNRELHEKLLQAQKLESLGVLASGMANDFDDLLVGILVNTRRALETGSEPNSDVLSGILKAGEQAGDLVSTLLAFAGEQQRAPHTLDLSQLVAETLPLVQTAVAKRASFELAAGRETPWIRADLAQVRQVLMNLITNGAESLSGSGGMVRVETGVGELSGARLARCVVGDPMAVGRSAFLVVEDDGCGIPKANLNRIFDPFYTTKFAGRGLGLAAVLGIVRSHGGALEVETQENRGSRFSVWFPLAEAPEQDDVAPSRR